MGAGGGFGCAKGFVEELDDGDEKGVEDVAGEEVLVYVVGREVAMVVTEAGE